MTEKEKMLRQELYDANYDESLIADRTRCKVLCQKYNNLPIDDFEAREKLIKEILGKTGKAVSDGTSRSGRISMPTTGWSFWTGAESLSVTMSSLLLPAVFILPDIRSTMSAGTRDWNMPTPLKSATMSGSGRGCRSCPA